MRRASYAYKQYAPMTWKICKDSLMISPQPNKTLDSNSKRRVGVGQASSFTEELAAHT